MIDCDLLCSGVPCTILKLKQLPNISDEGQGGTSVPQELVQDEQNRLSGCLFDWKG
jgi:hypothetical protein